MSQKKIKKQKTKIRITKMEIEHIEREGPLWFEFIDPLSYGETRERWEREFGIVLPLADELSRFGEPSDLRILCRRVTVTVTFSNSQWLQWQFEPGFITDLASVPSYFRSVVDNDDIQILIAALVHDYNFTTHGFTFMETNRLFYHMIRARDYPAIKSGFAFVAVSSPVGLYKWKQCARRRNDWTEKTARFMTGRAA